MSLDTTVEYLPALVWETDIEHRLTLLTGAEASTLDGAARSRTGESATSFFARLSPASPALRAHQAALRGEPASFEFAVGDRAFYAALRPLRSPDGTIEGVTGVAVDLTGRFLAERAIRFSEYSYRSLCEEAPFALCRSTLGGALLQANRAMAEMLGYSSAAQLLLRDLPLIFSPAGRFETFREALIAGSGDPFVESEWIRADGEAIHVRVWGRAVRDPAGGVSLLDIFAENITQIKQLETALSHAARMQALGQLAGGVAHDFNNLLTIIGGYVELLLADAATGGEGRDRLLAVRDAAGRAASLTRQLLAFGRRQVLQNQPLDVNEVIEGVIGILRRSIEESIDISFEPDDDLWPVKADPSEIERVLVNLAFNARDAMPNGGRLVLKTQRISIPVDRPLDQYRQDPDGIAPGDYVQIVVSDTGTGMDPATMARVFEPFFTTKATNQGTGLGLAVVYGIVRQSGGHIDVESEAGVGTAFRILLPRNDSAAAPNPRRASSESTRPGGTETILLAEDDDSIRGLIKLALERSGYTVLDAADGRKALDLATARDLQIDLLISDLVMPNMDGRELADRLKRLVPGLKIILISGYAGPSSEESALGLQGSLFLPKPFSLDLLVGKVAEVLRRSPSAVPGT